MGGLESSDRAPPSPGLHAGPRSRPASTREAIDQCATRDTKGATDRRLAGAAFECCDHGLELFSIHSSRATTVSPSPFGRGDACSDPFLCQGPLVLSERPKEVEEQLAMGCGGVHLLGERSETDAFVP